MGWSVFFFAKSGSPISQALDLCMLEKYMIIEWRDESTLILGIEFFP